MKFRNFAVATAAVSLAASPAIAEVAPERAPVEGESNVKGSGLLVALLAAAAIVAGIIVAADSGDDDAISA